MVAGDQTRGDSTPYVGGSQALTLSRGEVAALCMKAARGAGMAWGLAEEAGFAAGWLTERGVDGPASLLAHLTDAQGRRWSDQGPIVEADEWRAPSGGSLCPIALGASLCDHAELPRGPAAGRSLRIGPVDRPLLLIPFLAVVEEASGIVLSLDLQGAADDAREAGAGLVQAVSALRDRRRLSLRLSSRAGTPLPAPAAPVPDIAAPTVAGLNLLAMRTTVPASDASRAGAGSTTSDDD